jgi:AcrR family transcriptional regulator
MPRTGKDTKRKILQTSYNLFVRDGFYRVSVDAIAEASGITKKTLYYHFKSKDDLVAEMLEFQHAYALGAIQSWTDGLPNDPVMFVDVLFQRLGFKAEMDRIWLYTHRHGASRSTRTSSACSSCKSQSRNRRVAPHTACRFRSSRLTGNCPPTYIAFGRLYHISPHT